MRTPEFDGGGYLTLFAPLFYRPRAVDSGGAFALADEGGEALLHFEVAPAAAVSIEPAGEYLGRLLAAGTAGGAGAEPALVLPAGLYWFTQARARLDRAGFVEMAKEAQKEALWQRAKLGAGVYFRTLWEDGAHVSQVFRPVLKAAAG